MNNNMTLLVLLVAFGMGAAFLYTQYASTSPTITQSSQAGEEIKESFEEITLGHDGWNTIPQTVTLPAGKSYKFVITPETNGRGCMSTIKRAGTTAADSHLVMAGEPVEFSMPDAQPGEYSFVCNGMGMEQGKVIIQEVS